MFILFFLPLQESGPCLATAHPAHLPPREGDKGTFAISRVVQGDLALIESYHCT